MVYTALAHVYLRHPQMNLALPELLCESYLLTSADLRSTNIFWEWRSPRPIRYPAMALTAVARVYVRRFSNHVPGCRKFSRKKLCMQGTKLEQICAPASRETWDIRQVLQDDMEHPSQP